MVIRSLESEGSDSPKLAPLRMTAAQSRDAILAGDFPALGRAMTASTRGQENLHPALTGPDHHVIIDIARHHKALGWKVNGAGGHGGSVTVLCNKDPETKQEMIHEVLQQNPKYLLIPTKLAAKGLTTTIEEHPQ